MTTRRTAHRALALAQRDFDSRGSLAGASVRFTFDACTARVVNGTDPSVVDQLILIVESHFDEAPRDVRHVKVIMRMDPLALRGVVGPRLPVSLPPGAVVEWNLPPFGRNLPPGCCVHIRIKAADALGRWVATSDLPVAHHHRWGGRWSRSPRSTVHMGIPDDDGIRRVTRGEWVLNDWMKSLKWGRNLG